MLGLDQREIGFLKIIRLKRSKINENNYKKVAEVGIGYGTHAKYILRTTNIDTLYLVDPVQFYENDFFARDIATKDPEVLGNNFNELYELIQKELEPWSHRFQFLRVPSLNVREEIIPDNSLDCVFIDSDHSFKAVYADLHFWWNKLRIGGQLLGDDWWIDDVKAAALLFALDKNLSFHFLEKEGTNHKIFRFKKL